MSNINGNVLADLHHGDLYYSLHLLFEERLGMNLYRPIGIEWFEKGFWKIAEPYGNAPDTIDQFLGLPNASWSVEKEPTQKYGEITVTDDVFNIPVKVGSGEYVQKAITFSKFQQMPFDYIIASYVGHDEPYAELTKQYKPNAVYIRMIGNCCEYPKSTKNVLLAHNTDMPRGTNFVRYHPEIHEDYCYTQPTNHNVIKSFIAAPLAEPDLPLFYEFERLLPDFTFKMHGILGRDGVISGDQMPPAIKNAAFVWHVKHTGCGGFVARQALACGRPCLIRKNYCYKYTPLEMSLFEDGVNCIDLDLGTSAQNIERIRHYSEPERHIQMCRATAKKFKRDVDYAAEAKMIKEWLADLEGK